MTHKTKKILTIVTAVTLAMFIPASLGIYYWVNYAQKVERERPVINPLNPIKNVILMISDGVGEYHYKAAGLSYASTDWEGYMMTDSSSGTTDSAASATAMATGFKVKNNQVGIKGNQNISEYMKEQGKAVGIVTTDHLYGATPAGFSARANNRDQYEIIAQSQMASDIDLFMGMRGDPYYENDPRFLTYIFPALKPMVITALDRLAEYEDGFFLMAEGHRTDSNSHDGNLTGMITELVDFKNAVDYVVAWAKARGDTAVIVTSDHETGGLTYIGMGAGYVFTSGGVHTNVNVQFFMWGLTIKERLIDNTDIFHIIMNLVLTN